MCICKYFFEETMQAEFVLAIQITGPDGPNAGAVYSTLAAH